MKFLDEVTVEVSSGSGGPGSVHFRREKFVPKGGPDGGNGGNGGSVFLQLDSGRNTLLDLSFKPIWKAQNGIAGGGRCRDGANGEDLTIKVPAGTEIFDLEAADTESGEPFFLGEVVPETPQILIAQGGQGGKGNTFFKSATNQTPRYAQPGKPGETKKLRLVLKLIADVGLLGLPNAGKSTLISRISAARPKVADYPFTTLTPSLGVVTLEEEPSAASSNSSYVVADIPGLIPGAHLGKGLGTRFLQHIERCRALAHLLDIQEFLVDPTGRRLAENYCAIVSEVKNFSSSLSQRPQIVLLTKSDLLPEQGARQDLLEVLAKQIPQILPDHKFPDSKDMLFLSSATGENIKEAKIKIHRLLTKGGA